MPQAREGFKLISEGLPEEFRIVSMIKFTPKGGRETIFLATENAVFRLHHEDQIFRPLTFEVPE